MKKRLIAILLAAICLLLVPAPAASADALVEPDNSFYTRHWDECVRVDRYFYANGVGGDIRVLEEPGSTKEVTSVKNGEIVSVLYTYDHNGKLWGFAEIYAANAPQSIWQSGWVPMDNLLLVYDYISFEEDHADELYDYEGDLDALNSATDIVLWSWPGSGTIRDTLDVFETEGYAVLNAYKDEEGREWVFIYNKYGYRNVWICLNDPTNLYIPAFNPAPEPRLWQPDDLVRTTEQSPGEIVLIVVLVALMLACTAVLIRVQWKNRRRR